MKLTFTEEQIANELHKIYLEEDDLLMEGEFVTGEGKNYIITGVATIEGERYHEFEIEFELTEEPAEVFPVTTIAFLPSFAIASLCSATQPLPK